LKEEHLDVLNLPFFGVDAHYDVIPNLLGLLLPIRALLLI